VVYLFREKYYAGIKDDPELHVKLTGSWETLVGQQDTFGMSSTMFWFSHLDVVFDVKFIYSNTKITPALTRPLNS